MHALDKDTNGAHTFITSSVLWMFFNIYFFLTVISINTIPILESRWLKHLRWLFWCFSFDHTKFLVLNICPNNTFWRVMSSLYFKGWFSCFHRDLTQWFYTGSQGMLQSTHSSTLIYMNHDHKMFENFTYRILTDLVISLEIGLVLLLLIQYLQDLGQTV